MTDIVAELRHKAALKSLSGWGAQSQIAMGRAADEIERLRGLLRRAIREADDLDPAEFDEFDSGLIREMQDALPTKDPLTPLPPSSEGRCRRSE